MEGYTYDAKMKKIIEKFILGTYTLYVISMIFVATRMGWSTFAVTGFMGTLFGYWLVYLSKIKRYETRVRAYAVCMQLGIIIYLTNLPDLQNSLPMFLTFVVLLAVYGLPEVFWLPPITTIILYGYHCFVLKSIPISVKSEQFKVIFQLINILFTQYILYIWTKKTREGSQYLVNAIDELEEVQSSKDDFLANVSHEIRTPLNTICGMSELLLKSELDEDSKDKIRDIYSSGRTLMIAVRDILDYSELQAGTIELEEEVYNITTTINDVINMTKDRMKEKHLEYIVDCDANFPKGLLGDEKKLRRVILNLMDNAIKFTNEGGVCLRFRFRREAYGINLIVTIHDTGIGMTAENLEKLFQSFSQVDSSRKRQSGGLGLGLAISNALIKKMGGAITIKSKLGKGSVFQVVVPQKVLDETTIVELREKKEIKVATYIDMEQFSMMEIRDEYGRMISSILERMKLDGRVCRNIQELQRRHKNERFTHIFASMTEYRSYRKVFDELSESAKVVVVLFENDEREITNPRIVKLFKPFYVASIGNILNHGSQGFQEQDGEDAFVAEGAKVLVVDDNRTNLRVIEGMLQEYKIVVVKAESGKEAIEKITSADYDFVFMDHMMPEMDGVETLHKIRHLVGSYYQNVPIIALTANAVAGTRELLLKEGFDDFLEKPVEKSVLERVLKRTLRKERIVFLDKPNPKAEVSQEDRSYKNIREDLEWVGLNVERGMLYCNGISKYISILLGCCEDYEKTRSEIQTLYRIRDWKNYVIAVHGIKGAMGNIGAEMVSELAKKLEFAGKENNIRYIEENHGVFIHEYERLFAELRNCLNFKETEAEEQDDVVYVEIAKEMLCEKVKGLENAAYELNEAKMLELVEELEHYRFKDAPLKKVLAPVRRKIEASDCLSAAELANRLVQEL